MSYTKMYHHLLVHMLAQGETNTSGTNNLQCRYCQEWIMALTARFADTVKAEDKDRKHSDGNGLYLLVKTNGAKYWRMSYRYQGKQKTLALGVFPQTSLKEARNKLFDARKLLENETDPAQIKRARKAAALQSASDCFESIAREWFEVKMADRSKSHRDRTIRALEKDLFNQLGTKPIASISAPELLAALRKIEARGAVETAHRAKQTAGQVFRYAIATGRAERDPSADLKGALKTPVETHFAAITEPAAAGQLLRSIDQYQGTPSVRSALKLSPLLFARPGEIRHMEWSEINWDERRWEIPASKMKTRNDHIVPLSKQAIKILQDQQSITGRGKYVFPSARGASRPLSENGVRTALRTMGYDNNTMTPHGFRAMARTLLDEVLEYPPEWIEHQLAHAVSSPLGTAYNRTKHLSQRTEMMQTWGDYLDSLKGAPTPRSEHDQLTPSHEEK